MRVSFNLRDPEEFSSFFSMDAEYIDVVLNDYSIFFINLRNSFYAHKSYNIVTRDANNIKASFRVHRKLFLSVLDKAIITIEILGDNQVTIYFSIEDGETDSFVMTIEHQIPEEGKILALSKFSSPEYHKTLLNLNPLKSKMSLIKSFDGMISVNEHKRIRMSRPEADLYIQTKSDRISIQPIFLDYLLNHSEEIYGYRSAIIGIDEGSCIVVEQAIDIDTDDYQFVSRMKVMKEFSSDLSPLYRLVKKSPKEIKTVGVDFLNGKGYIKGDTLRLARSFNTEEMNSGAAELDLDTLDFTKPVDIGESEKYTLEFPVEMFRDVFHKVGARLKVRVGKKLVTFGNDKDILIVMRRVNVDES